MQTDRERTLSRRDGSSIESNQRPAESASARVERAEPPLPPPAPPIIRLVNVHKSFGSLRVLSGINLDFITGKTMVIMGPSGTGKSVMLKIITGLLRPDNGEVYFGSSRIDNLPEAKLGDVRQQIGFLFQQGALFDSMNVERNVAFPLVEHTHMPKDEVRSRVREVLDLVGLQGSEPKMPVELSGGQRKRVALARAIILNPKVILYDEPTTGLDPIRADVINELIIKLSRELRVTSIVVTHDLTSAFKVADTMVMLYDGSILEQGSTEAFRESGNPIVRRFLRGEADEKELAGIRANTR